MKRILIPVLAGCLLLAACGGSDDSAGSNGDGDGTTLPTAGEQTADVAISGAGLTPFPQGVSVSTDPGADPAIGAVAPSLTGTNFAGETVTIEPGDSATVVMFVAHWCSHCQREVPAVQQLVDDGKLPAGVELVAVSTAVREGESKYPPQEWLEDEGWSSAVMRDAPANDAVLSYGAGGFPYTVYLNADNEVVARSAGQLDAATIEALWLAAAGS